MAKYRVRYTLECAPRISGGAVLYPVEVGYETFDDFNEAYCVAEDVNIQEPGQTAEVEVWCDEHGWSDYHHGHSIECATCRER